MYTDICYVYSSKIDPQHNLRYLQHFIHNLTLKTNIITLNIVTYFII